MTQQVVCEHCGHEIAVDRPYTVFGDKETVKSILTYDFYKVKCPSCGSVIESIYPFNYVDEKLNIVIIQGSFSEVINSRYKSFDEIQQLYGKNFDYYFAESLTRFRNILFAKLCGYDPRIALLMACDQLLLENLKNKNSPFTSRFVFELGKSGLIAEMIPDDPDEEITLDYAFEDELYKEYEKKYLHIVNKIDPFAFTLLRPLTILNSIRIDKIFDKKDKPIKKAIVVNDEGDIFFANLPPYMKDLKEGDHVSVRSETDYRYGKVELIIDTSIQKSCYSLINSIQVVSKEYSNSLKRDNKTPEMKKEDIVSEDSSILRYLRLASSRKDIPKELLDHEFVIGYKASDGVAKGIVPIKETLDEQKYLRVFLSPEDVKEDASFRKVKLRDIIANMLLFSNDNGLCYYLNGKIRTISKSFVIKMFVFYEFYESPRINAETLSFNKEEIDHIGKERYLFALKLFLASYDKPFKVIYDALGMSEEEGIDESYYAKCLINDVLLYRMYQR